MRVWAVLHRDLKTWQRSSWDTESLTNCCCAQSVPAHLSYTQVCYMFKHHQQQIKLNLKTCWTGTSLDVWHIMETFSRDPAGSGFYQSVGEKNSSCSKQSRFRLVHVFTLRWRKTSTLRCTWAALILWSVLVRNQVPTEEPDLYPSSHRETKNHLVL